MHRGQPGITDGNLMQTERRTSAARACPFGRRRTIRLGVAAASFTFAAGMSSLHAAQVDIAAPAGSGWFGYAVAVLPNGHLVVTDPRFSTASAQHVGAVHLFTSSGKIIGSLTGSSANDHVGSGGVVMLGGGRFVVASPDWDQGSATDAGSDAYDRARRQLVVGRATQNLVSLFTMDQVFADTFQ